MTRMGRFAAISVIKSKLFITHSLIFIMYGTVFFSWPAFIIYIKCIFATS